MLQSIYLIYVWISEINPTVPLSDALLAVQSEATSRPHVVDLVTSLAPSQAPQTRSKAKATSDKPALDAFKNSLFDFTPLTSLFIDGMDEEQVWAQLDLRTQSICRMLDFVLEGEVGAEEGKEDSEEESSGDDEEQRLKEALEALEGGDIDMDEFMAKYGLDEHDEMGDELDESDDSQREDSLDDDSEDAEEVEEAEEDVSPLRDEESDHEAPDLPPTKPSKKRKRGESSELDDGFFNLAEFNAYTERAEAKSSSRGRLSGDDSDEEDMDVDLFASVDGPVDLGDEDEAESKGTCHSPFF